MVRASKKRCEPASFRVRARLDAIPSPRFLRIRKTKNLHNFSVFNRFKFSSVPDFYVPNKTQYKDYVEFIKNLPSKTDSELFDLDPKSQARNIP